MTTDEKPQYIYYYTMYTYTNRLEFSLICYKILLGVFAGDFPSKCTTTQRWALQQWRLFCSCRYIMVRVENGRHRGHCALSTSISHSLSLIHIYPAAMCVAVFGCVYILFFAIQTRHTMFFFDSSSRNGTRRGKLRDDVVTLFIILWGDWCGCWGTDVSHFPDDWGTSGNILHPSGFYLSHSNWNDRTRENGATLFDKSCLFELIWPISLLFSKLIFLTHFINNYFHYFVLIKLNHFNLIFQVFFVLNEFP
jgi:hypothetical protein